MYSMYSTQDKVIRANIFFIWASKETLFSEISSTSFMVGFVCLLVFRLVVNFTSNKNFYSFVYTP